MLFLLQQQTNSTSIAVYRSHQIHKVIQLITNSEFNGCLNSGANNQMDIYKWWSTFYNLTYMVTLVNLFHLMYTIYFFRIISKITSKSDTLHKLAIISPLPCSPRTKPWRFHRQFISYIVNKKAHLISRLFISHKYQAIVITDVF